MTEFMTSELWAPGDRRSAPTRARRRLFVFAALVLVIAALRVGRPLLAPIALAAFITVVSLPPLQWMRRKGLPLPVAIALIVLMDAIILGGVGLILLQSAVELRAAAPAYVERIQEIEMQMIMRLEGWGYRMAPGAYREFVNPERLLGFAAGAAVRLTSVVLITLLVLLYVVFMLAESVALPDKLKRAFGNRYNEARVREIVRDVQRYLTLKTLISLTGGILVGVGTALIGVDFPLLWGFLAFVLNYVPNVGSLMASLPAIAVALLQLGPGAALLVALMYVTIEVVLGTILDPIIVGRQLRLSTLVVLLALMFWGWAWGIVGLFLAVPLTAAAKIVMENSPSLRPVAVLLGPVKERRRTALPPPRPVEL
jgi:AI-2 transport protein TqsA